jgi:phosphoglycerate dehydrogenase-like enzyme
VGDRSLHVVFGAGHVGRTLAAQLTGLGLPARVVSRHQPGDLTDALGIEAPQMPRR